MFRMQCGQNGEDYTLKLASHRKETRAFLLKVPFAFGRHRCPPKTREFSLLFLGSQVSWELRNEVKINGQIQVLAV